MKEKWTEAPRLDGNQVYAEKFGISPMTVRLIRNRGVNSIEEMEQYLHGTMDDLYDPFLMKDMDRAVDVLIERMNAGAKIRVIGDYDIDGVNATYILLKGLRDLGAAVDTAIPDRIKDGYGLNENLIRQAYEDKIDTIVTCDNGIAASEEIALGKSLGMTVVVTDHHEVPFEDTEEGRIYHLPQADAIIDPKRADCPYPFKHLCGATVALKLVQALYRKLGKTTDVFGELLEFAAFATIGDIMELRGENRIIVREGLKKLANTSNPGYRALIELSGLADKKLTPYHVGFVLGPCINASGRLDTARRALELLSAKTRQEAETLAGDLKALNESRKELTLKGTQEAVRLVEETSLKDDKVLVVYLEDCHESLAGIIAGRIREKFGKPTFVLTNAENGVKGSGRSTESYSMFEELCKVSSYLTKFGGHPMAAGISLERADVDAFRNALNEACLLTEDQLRPEKKFDGILPIRYAGEQLIDEIALLEPFGKGNESPLFAETSAEVLSARVIGKNRNVLKLRLRGKESADMDGIMFCEADEMLAKIEQNSKLCMLYYPEFNEYMGRKSLQIVISAIQN